MALFRAPLYLVRIGPEVQCAAFSLGFAGPILFMPAVTVFLFFSAALCAALLGYATRQRRERFPRYFIGLMCISCLYAVGYGAELMAPDLETMNRMLRVQYLGIPFLSLCWVGLAWSYLDSRGLPRPLRYFLLLVGCAVLLAFQTNEFHHLFYTGIAFERIDGLSIAHARKGPLYWFHIAFLNLAIAFGVVLFFRAWRQSMRIYRAQSFCLLIGSFFPWGFHLFYLAGLSPYQMDLGPFGLAASGVLFSVAAFRHGMLDILPVARDLVFDGLSEGVIVLDGREQIIDFNRAATGFVPGLGPQAIGQPLAALASGQPIAEAIRKSRASDPGAGPLCAEIAVAGDGGEHYYELRLSPRLDRDGVVQCHALLLLDVTEKRQLLAQLHQLASIDPLTGALNRRQLDLEARRLFRLAQRTGAPLSVALIDIDHFKAINDSQGHQAGDERLCQIAALMRARLRATDVLGRLGGDEFVVVLPSTGSAAALALMAGLNERCQVENGSTLSIGVAEWHPRVPDLEALLAEADQALYRAKRAGRNQVMTLAS